MKIPSSVDRETFQQLLANAFAVQESQISSQSLAAILDVQRSIAGGKLDLDGVMRRIVESAQNVANATGVAIALLKRDQLTYRAGIGSSVPYLGRQVTASLTVSANGKTNREILRVENADTDTRIEAAICRQFGANALLFLPVYQDGAVAGVLDVRFNEAHTFGDLELRTYRLMAEQIEAALNQDAQLGDLLERGKTTAAPPVPDAPEQLAAPELEVAPLEEDFVPPPAFMMLPQNEHSLYARCRAVLADVMQLTIFKQSAWVVTMLTQRAKRLVRPRSQRTVSVPVATKLPTFKRPTLLTHAQRAKILAWPNRWRNTTQAMAAEVSSVFKRTAWSATLLAHRAKNFTWPNRWRNSARAAVAEFSSAFQRTASSANLLVQRARGAKNLSFPSRWRNPALAAAAVVLAITASIGYRSRGPAKSFESFTVPTAIDPSAQLSKPLPEKATAAVQPALVPSNETTHAKSGLRRVRIGPNEVDYISDDVTVRTFTDRSPAKHTRVASGRIAKFGNDVTVRYFSPPASITKTAAR